MAQDTVRGACVQYALRYRREDGTADSAWGAFAADLVDKAHGGCNFFF